MYELVPEDFDVPAGLEHERFRLRMLTVDDVVKDFDAFCSLKPSESHDVRVQLWVRKSAWDNGLDPLLEAAVRDWVATRWPFDRVSFEERDR